MSRKPIGALAVLAAATLVLAGTALSRSARTPTLKGVVGPGYSIKLTKNGVKVTSLKAGFYRFVITDKSSFHNFTIEREKPVKIEKHLSTTAFTGTTKGIVVNLKPGKWKYYCSVHESQMFGFFKVTR
jgi:plastocyanin